MPQPTEISESLSTRACIKLSFLKDSSALIHFAWSSTSAVYLRVVAQMQRRNGMWRIVRTV